MQLQESTKFQIYVAIIIVGCVIFSIFLISNIDRQAKHNVKDMNEFKLMNCEQQKQHLLDLLDQGYSNSYIYDHDKTYYDLKCGKS